MAHDVCKDSQNKELQFHLYQPVSLEKDLQREQRSPLWEPAAQSQDLVVLITALKQQSLPSQIYVNSQLERVCPLFLNT